jgi:hypothetical protein
MSFMPSAGIGMVVAKARQKKPCHSLACGGRQDDGIRVDGGVARLVRVFLAFVMDCSRVGTGIA